MEDKQITEWFESLSSEIAALGQEMKTGFAEVNQRLDLMNARLEKQGGIIQGGSRQVSRLISWSEDTDSLLTLREGQLIELQRDLHKLERNAAARDAELSARIAKLEAQDAGR